MADLFDETEAARLLESDEGLHGVAGTTMHPDDDLDEFRRGGRTLAVVHHGVDASTADAHAASSSRRD